MKSGWKRTVCTRKFTMHFNVKSINLCVIFNYFNPYVHSEYDILYL